MLQDRAKAVWLGLVGATAVSWMLGSDHGTGNHPRLVGALILCVAFLKVRFIGLYFMELRASPALLRSLFQGYCVLGFFVLLGSYLLA